MGFVFYRTVLLLVAAQAAAQKQTGILGPSKTARVDVHKHRAVQTTPLMRRVATKNATKNGLEDSLLETEEIEQSKIEDIKSNLWKQQLNAGKANIKHSLSVAMTGSGDAEANIEATNKHLVRKVSNTGVDFPPMKSRKFDGHSNTSEYLKIDEDDDGEYLEASAPWEAPTCTGKSMCKFVKKTSRPHDFQDSLPQNSGMCYLVSHKYKFIGFKITKTASSTVLKKFKDALCGVRFQGPFSKDAKCPDPDVLDHGQAYGGDCVKTLPPPETWDEYFVFAIVRNPWSRRASMGHYCHLSACDVKPGTKCGRCPWSHCVPYGPGVMSPDGESFVDFIGHSEHLDDDLETILRTVAQRHAQSNGGQGITWMNKTVHQKAENVGPVSDYAQEYAKSPSCIAAVEHLFPIDASTVFGYQPPPIKNL